MNISVGDKVKYIQSNSAHHGIVFLVAKYVIWVEGKCGSINKSNIVDLNKSNDKITSGESRKGA